MTTLQKAFVAATLAVVAGTGIYEARPAAKLRNENQKLRQPQAEQIGQFQRERDDATNRLASLAEETVSLKEGNGELLKLRGEVARLRAEAESSPGERLRNYFLPGETAGRRHDSKVFEPDHRRPAAVRSHHHRPGVEGLW